VGLARTEILAYIPKLLPKIVWILKTEVQKSMINQTIGNGGWVLKQHNPEIKGFEIDGDTGIVTVVTVKLGVLSKVISPKGDERKVSGLRGFEPTLG
jgi:hypothetical protein